MPGWELSLGNPAGAKRREFGMKAVIRTLFIAFLFLVGSEILFQGALPSLFAQAPSPSSLIATEQDVKDFFAQYIERYNTKDIEEFLSLFSLKAKQNQREGLPEIRMIYTNLFNRSSSLQLSVEDMTIEIYQNAVEIKGRYTVNQVLKDTGGKKVWKGDARWVLGREEEKLQILTFDYEYSLPPTGAGGEAAEPPPLIAQEEEVEQFFSKYIDRYHRKDVDGFLSFFSSKALQNQKDGIEGIRTIYTKFFDESKNLRFQVEGKRTEIYQNRVEVKGRFRVDQTLKKGKKEMVWTGDIRWVLGKEDGALKILSLDYQNDKSL